MKRLLLVLCIAFGGQVFGQENKTPPEVQTEDVMILINVATVYYTEDGIKWIRQGSSLLGNYSDFIYDKWSGTRITQLYMHLQRELFSFYFNLLAGNKLMEIDCDEDNRQHIKQIIDISLVEQIKLIEIISKELKRKIELEDNMNIGETREMLEFTELLGKLQKFATTMQDPDYIKKQLESLEEKKD
tara:strand:+ start:251 stop:811 length:561 start_codon:yes stop_codon:yes gene_type:complete